MNTPPADNPPPEIQGSMGHAPSSATTPTFEVELPGGGPLRLQSIDEVELWDESKDKYIEDYQLMQQNDLLLLGAILSQQIMMFRAQQKMNGMEVERNQVGLPTGKYVHGNPSAREMSAAQNIIIKAAGEIRELEKALGIDKKTREQGGTHTVAAYVTTLKAAAREFGLHLSRRLTEYERVCMDARQRLRVLRNADPEDRSYQGVSPESICDWLAKELDHLEEIDKEFAKQKQRLYLGKI